ncbi:MAG: AAA family ATPase [Clostridia bacterium]|nr:AAA family ATPase [Clostridia bacterium]
MKRLKSSLPGSESYIDTVTSHYYVDKTMLIKELLDVCPSVVLFSRPRRFGKSLTLSMIQTFFEKTDRDASVYFKDKNIWKSGKKYTEEQGRYPVIRLSFHAVDDNTWEDCLGNIRIQISEEFKRHSELAEPGILSGLDLKAYNDIASFIADADGYASSLLLLSRLLEQYHKVPAVILIDDYDTPLRTGHGHGYYSKVRAFMNDLCSRGLTDNPSVKFGVLAGIQTASQTGLFLPVLQESSGTPNGNDYFGFTSDEVIAMLAYYGVQDKYDELSEWYGGYMFGGAQVFNPWSVLYYIYYKCVPDTYWGDTADGSDLRAILMRASTEDLCNLIHMADGGTVEAAATDALYSGSCYPDGNPYEILLSTGYLTATKANADATDNRSLLKMPNLEVKTIFHREILPADISAESFADMYKAVENYRRGTLPVPIDISKL